MKCQFIWHNKFQGLGIYFIRYPSPIKWMAYIFRLEIKRLR